jgi:hypothetical protein
MEQIDISGIAFILPILSFLLVFIIVFALLHKSKVVDSNWVEMFISFIFATIFASAVGPRDYVINVIPWVGVLAVTLFIIVAMLGFIGGDIVKNSNKGIGIGFIIVLLIIFLISAIVVFSSYFSPYLPGGDVTEANPQVLVFLDWLFSTKIFGAVILLVVGALFSWIVVRNVK